MPGVLIIARGPKVLRGTTGFDGLAHLTVPRSALGNYTASASTRSATFSPKSRRVTVRENTTETAGFRQSGCLTGAGASASKLNAYGTTVATVINGKTYNDTLSGTYDTCSHVVSVKWTFNLQCKFPQGPGSDIFQGEIQLTGSAKPDGDTSTPATVGFLAGRVGRGGNIPQYIKESGASPGRGRITAATMTLDLVGSGQDLRATPGYSTCDSVIGSATLVHH